MTTKPLCALFATVLSSTRVSTHHTIAMPTRLFLAVTFFIIQFVEHTSPTPKKFFVRFKSFTVIFVEFATMTHPASDGTTLSDWLTQ